MANWRILRKKRDTEDDPDSAGLQEVGPLFPDPNTLVAPILRGKIRLAVVFVDENNKAVTTGRGSFDLEFLEVVFERDQVGVIIPNTLIILDGVTLRGGIGFRAMTVDDLSDAQLFSIRLINIDPPEGATGMRVYCRELES